MRTRQVKGAVKAMPIKTDRRDAEGIARLLHLGWFRRVRTNSSQHEANARTARCPQESAAGSCHSEAVIAWIAAELMAEVWRDLAIRG